MIQSLIQFIQSWDAWVWFGFVAQACFFMRFFVQWVATERAGRVVIPIAFWYFSCLGGVLILVYALVRKDIVFILGSALSLVIYGRNLMVQYREDSGKVKVLT